MVGKATLVSILLSTIKRDMKIPVTLCIILSSICLQAQKWEWVFRAGDQFLEQGRDVALDSSGNVYVVGRGAGPEFSLTCGNSAAVVAKFSPAGSLIWSLNIFADPVAISTDVEGNAYVVGQVTQTNSFCDGLGGEVTATVTAGNFKKDAFIAKYSSQGILLWIHTWGYSDCDEYVMSVKADPSLFSAANRGGVYVTGYSDGPSLGQKPPQEYFLKKLDGNGSLIWEDKSGFKGRGVALDIDADLAGNCYIAGDINDTAFFRSAMLTGKGGFLGKYTRTGDLAWVKKEGTNRDNMQSIAVDNLGNLFVTGRYISPSTFGSATLSGGWEGRQGMFVAKYDTAGSFIWVKGSSAQGGHGVTPDQQGGCYVAAFYTETASFANSNNTITLQSSKAGDLAVVKFNQFGEAAWAATTTGSPGPANFAPGIVSSGDGSCFVTGCYTENTQFDNWLFTASGNLSGQDLFLAKIEDLPVTTGINDVAINKRPMGLSISPNPARNSVYFKITTESPKNITVKVFDSQSRIVLEKTLRSQDQNGIDIILDNLNKGLYFVSVISEAGEAVSGKFIGL